MRRRGNSWELRAYAGTDPETGKRNWVSATVKGSCRSAPQDLVELVRRVDYPRRMTSKITVEKLLIDWYESVSSKWGAPHGSSSSRSNEHSRSDSPDVSGSGGLTCLHGRRLRA